MNFLRIYSLRRGRPKGRDTGPAKYIERLLFQPRTPVRFAFHRSTLTFNRTGESGRLEVLAETGTGRRGLQRSPTIGCFCAC